MEKFKLPEEIRELVQVRNKLRTRYHDLLASKGSKAILDFTLDGKLVGDIGEAVAVELFGIRLTDDNSSAGIDGMAPDNRTTVQVKATGTNRGPVFRNTKIVADHLLFFRLDYENLCGEVVYNGPERPVRDSLKEFTGQRMVSRKWIQEAGERVQSRDRLARIWP